MTLVATPGALDANSYCSLAEADAYHNTRGHNDEWAVATPEDKEKFLLWAQRLLDQEDWTGSKNSYTQPLRWPRGSVRDQDGYIYLNTVIPQWLKNAQAELAFHFIRDDRTEDQGNLQSRHEQLGSMQSTDTVRVCIPAAVRDMISPYVSARFRTRRA